MTKIERNRAIRFIYSIIFGGYLVRVRKVTKKYLKSIYYLCFFIHNYLLLIFLFVVGMVDLVCQNLC